MPMEAWQETAIGVIMMIVLGPAVGNYATSVVYRLPFGQTPFEKNPYCGDCGTMLAPKDLFPILSFLSTLGKCRYCGVKIRPSYTAVEVACGIIFVVNYLLFGISEDFILITTIEVFLVILCGLEYHEGKIYTLIWTYIVALAAILRVLHDGSIYPFFYTAFTMLFIGIVGWRSMVLFKLADAKKVPKLLWLMVMMGVLVPVDGMEGISFLRPLLTLAAASIVIYGVQYLFIKQRANASIPFSLAIFFYYYIYGISIGMK